jgi:hypothetical protein
MVSIHSQLNPLHTLPLCFQNNPPDLHIFLLSDLFCQVFIPKLCMHFYSLIHAILPWYMTRSTTYEVLRHAVFSNFLLFPLSQIQIFLSALSWCERLRFTPIQSKKKIIIYKNHDIQAERTRLVFISFSNRGVLSATPCIIFLSPCASVLHWQ